MRPSRSLVALLVAVVSAALIGYALFGGSDEDRILARLKELAHAVETVEDESILFRRARVNRAFKDGLEPNASLTAPELPSTTGIKELVELATVAAGAFGQMTLSVGETDIHIDRAAHEAHAVSLVTLTAARGGELRREKRHVRFVLHQSGGDWRVAVIDVEPLSEDQPEARP